MTEPTSEGVCPGNLESGLLLSFEVVKSVSDVKMAWGNLFLVGGPRPWIMKRMKEMSSEKS